MRLSNNATDDSGIVYTPWAHTGFGLRVWAEMLRELLGGRELMWRLFIRDLSAQYRQSVFGYFWAVMPAIITTLIFTFLKRRGTLSVGQATIPYPAFVLSGLTVWLLFSNGLTKTAQSLSNARAIIVHINFSREALVIAAFGDSVFNFLIRLVLIAAVFAWYRIIPMWTTLLVPVILIPLALMTVGLGFILALANGIFRDVANSLTLLLTLAMFLSPVIYKPSTTKGLLSYLNPVSPFIIATRDLVTSGTLSKPYWLLWASAAGVAVFFVGWRIFHLAMTRIAERV